MAQLSEEQQPLKPNELLRQIRKWLIMPSSDGIERTAWPELVAQIDAALLDSDSQTADIEALQWTKGQPKINGWYWVRDSSTAPVLVEILHDCAYLNCSRYLPEPDDEWLGPVTPTAIIDAATAMRDKCVGKLHQVRDNHLVSNNEHYEKGFNAALVCAELAMRSLTLE